MLVSMFFTLYFFFGVYRLQPQAGLTTGDFYFSILTHFPLTLNCYFRMISQVKIIVVVQFANLYLKHNHVNFNVQNQTAFHTSFPRFSVDAQLILIFDGS